MPSAVADEYLRHAVHARVVRIARAMGAPLAAVLVDIEDAAAAGRAAVMGDADGLLLHVAVPRCPSTDRSHYVDGTLSRLVEGALAPFALA